MKVCRPDHDVPEAVVVPPELAPHERLLPERVVVPDGGVCGEPLVAVVPPELPPCVPH